MSWGKVPLRWNFLEVHQAIACSAENTNLCPKPQEVTFVLKGMCVVLPSLGFFTAESTSDFRFRDDTETTYKEIKLYTIEKIEIDKYIHV